MQGYSPVYNYNGLYNNQAVSNPIVSYQDRMLPMQQMQQQYNPQQQLSQQYFQPMNNLLGKIVDSVEVVKATDIPMDGNCYYFPKADGTEVYAKRWLANGTTEVLTYKPAEQSAVQPEVVDMKTFCNDVTGKLDNIDDRIGKLEKVLSVRSSASRTKKEEAEV